MKQTQNISWSHCSLAAITSAPKVFHELSEIILQRQAWWVVEIGIETGSPEIAKKIMPTKAPPLVLINGMT
ncbi:MAG: hypothetical protein LBQ98_08865 [Nitrososphaerota archaeon]|jgi:radical SAM superfamily enzyme YgiQ (UPF0313 family)|nr:hypothetical protein [Nitrososphaerota archaeon]